MKAILLILSLYITCAIAKADEELPSIVGTQALRISCDTASKLALVRFFAKKPGFDFTQLTSSSNSSAEVLVSGSEVDDFKVFLDANEIKYETVAEDVSRSVKEHLRELKRSRAKRSAARRDILDSFPRYDEIIAYLKDLAVAHRDKVTYLSLGRSYENREIAALKISSGGWGKPSVLLDAGIHAREWIAPTTALYAIKALVENSTNSDVFRNVDVYVLPLLNPDGYEFSHLMARTRLWRKTRSVNGNSRCRGVDANRNFDNEWGVVGASSDPCSDTYAGPRAFSERETVALRDFILSQKQLKVYISLHSAASAILYPWGHTLTPVFSKDLHCVGRKAEAAIARVRGTRYEVGNSAALLYPASGGSDDWAMAKAGVELAYTIELPSKKFLFLAPISEIKPIGEETFQAIRLFAKYAEVGSCARLG